MGEPLLPSHRLMQVRAALAEAQAAKAAADAQAQAAAAARADLTKKLKEAQAVSKVLGRLMWSHSIGGGVAGCGLRRPSHTSSSTSKNHPSHPTCGHIPAGAG